MATNNPVNKIWLQKSYYEIAKRGSLDTTHPSFALIKKYGGRAKRILDLGCGEGTRLSLIKNGKAEKIGVDISITAIALAKKQYRGIKFVRVGDKLPFNDSYFDFVYSAFVLEHTRNSEQFIKEAVRVLAPEGILLLVAPNFGSPNRVSPNNRANRFVKILRGFGNDLAIIFRRNVESLTWQKVKPKLTYSEIDADTTVEPYLLTLIKFLRGLGVKNVKSSSLWNMEQGLSFSQLPFRPLGMIGLPPFNYWGPHLLFVGQKYA